MLCEAVGLLSDSGDAWYGRERTHRAAKATLLVRSGRLGSSGKTARPH